LTWNPINANIPTLQDAHPFLFEIAKIRIFVNHQPFFVLNKIEMHNLYDGLIQIIRMMGIVKR